MVKLSDRFFHNLNQGPGAIPVPFYCNTKDFHHLVIIQPENL